MSEDNDEWVDSETDDLRAGEVARLLDLLEAERSAGETWLDGEMALPVVDLRTLLGEMTALKAAVRAETSTSRDLRGHLETSVDDLRRELERASRREEILREEAARQRSDETRRSAMDLIDLADRLEPALERAREMARPRWLWLRKRPDPAAVSLVEGLELSLQRLTRKLADRGLTRIKCVGHRFDPETMQAMDTVSLESLPAGRVVAEVSAGYVTETSLLRPAQVVVNRRIDELDED